MVSFHGATAADLKAQIGTYYYKENKVLKECKYKESCIKGKGLVELHQGIRQYENAHKGKVNTYKNSHKIHKSNVILNDPQYFRKRLIDYISGLTPPTYDGNNSTRKTNPEAATITMEELLGAEGVELYRLALEEEAYSREYRHALVINATTHLDGPKWTERPVVIVAGPSACGKSFAANTAVKTASKFLPSSDTEEGNDVVSVDGGLSRETSQMRKLLVQVATNQGYSGIIDLHNKSKILEEVKSRVQEAAFASPGVGVVIPETFKGWFTPGDPIKSLMKKIEQLPNTKLIFTRIEGEEPSIFQKVVAFMGSRRAWKVDDFKKEKVDLNNTDITESKKYQTNGFHFGRIGSMLAERWFRDHSRDKLSMIITNELILLKPNPHPNPDSDISEDWVPAKQEDEGTAKFARSSYEQWNKLDKSSRPSLIDYCAIPAKPIIETSSQIDFAIAQKELVQRIKYTENEYRKAILQRPPNPKRIEYLIGKQQFLSNISKISFEKLNTQEDIIFVRQQVSALTDVLETKKRWPFDYFNKTLNVLKNIDSALQKASFELKSVQPISLDVPENDATRKMKSKLESLLRTKSKESSEEDPEPIQPIY